MIKVDKGWLLLLLFGSGGRGGKWELAHVKGVLNVGLFMTSTVNLVHEW